ncbi:MAG: non-heme iron oxygenase ferredoxin subunit [Deltaproteobacteria bacterium]|nr:non-heme iron oxygenase ferredoxin subunit [Deltaproteobacteria bacterium]
MSETCRTPRPICKIGEIDPGTVKRVDVHGLPPLAVYNVAGRFYVTDDACSHGKASLSEGYVEGAEIECPWHGGRFDIASGRATCLPAAEPVATYAVTVVGDEVCIGA